MLNLSKNYIMVVGTLDKYGLINSWYKDTADTIQELMNNLKEYYKKSGTTWEEKPYHIRVYRLIREKNGYVHTSNVSYYSDTTEKYWLK